MTETKRARRTLVSLVLFASMGLSPAWAQEPVADGDAGGDATAVAINTKDGSSVFRLTFRINREGGDTVDNQNAAVAFASCEGCQTVAISIQTVFVLGDPTIVTPGNFAIAINYECTSCETLASAYQFVLGQEGPVHFTAEGNQAIARIRTAIRDLGAGDLSIAEIQAALGVLIEEFKQVLAEELVVVGAVEPQDIAASGDSPSEGQSAESPAPAASGTPGDGEQSPTASPSPAPTPPPSPSPSPSPSQANPSPSPS